MFVTLQLTEPGKEKQNDQRHLADYGTDSGSVLSKSGCTEGTQYVIRSEVFTRANRGVKVLLVLVDHQGFGCGPRYFSANSSNIFKFQIAFSHSKSHWFDAINCSTGFRLATLPAAVFTIDTQAGLVTVLRSTCNSP